MLVPNSITGGWYSSKGILWTNISFLPFSTLIFRLETRNCSIEDVIIYSVYYYCCCFWYILYNIYLYSVCVCECLHVGGFLSTDTNHIVLSCLMFTYILYMYIFINSEWWWWWIYNTPQCMIIYDRIGRPVIILEGILLLWNILLPIFCVLHMDICVCVCVCVWHTMDNRMVFTISLDTSICGRNDFIWDDFNYC